MQIYHILSLVITVLLLIHFIPDYELNRYEFLINIIRGAGILTVISCIILLILSFI